MTRKEANESTVRRNQMATETIMGFIFGLSLGAIVPTAFALKTVLKSILIETRGFKDIEQRLDNAEREVRRMMAEEKSKQYETEAKDGIMFAVPTGMESPDDWYHAEFGGGK